MTAARPNPSTVVIVLLCLGVFAVAQLTDPENVRFLAFDHAELPERWWAIVTYGFVHVEWNHIIVNMLILVWVGVWVERLIGTTRFAVVVLVATLAGGATLLVRETAGIGFSAAAAGLLTYYHLAFPWERELPLRIPNIVLPLLLVAGSVAAIVFGWFPTVGHYPHLAGAAAGVLLLGAFRGHHRPLDDDHHDDHHDDQDDRPRPPTSPGRADGERGSTVGLGSRAVRRARQWWEDSSYLTDVALAFAAVTVVNSTMMVTGWDTPKTGTFAYGHLLSRLAIVAAVVALFHLDGIRSLPERWRGLGVRRGRPRILLRRQLATDPLGRWVTAFTLVVVAICLTALVSALWREPPAGAALYGALLGIAVVVAALVARFSWSSE